MRIVLAIVTALAIVAAVPVLVVAPTLSLVPIAGGDWGIAWTSLVVGPNAARGAALDGLVTLVTVAAACVVAVALLTILALSIARGTGRRSEIVVRRAVGASRGVLRRAALREGGIVAVAALLAGLAGARVAVAALGALWPGAAGARLGVAALVVPFALAAAVVLGALVPLVYARQRLPGADAAGRSVPLFVPSVQFGFGLLGVIGGAQLARAAAATTAAHPAAAAGAVFDVTPRAGTASPATRAHRYATLLDTLRRDSRVALASLVSPGTHLGIGTVDYVTTECGRCFDGGLPKPWHVFRATNHLVSADTFQAMGVQVVEGRGLRDADRWGAAPVAVVSRSLADRDFEGGRAVGRRVRVGPPDAWYTVVGIVADGQFAGIGASAEPRFHVYLSALQHPAATLELLVRSTQVPAPAVATLVLPALGAGALGVPQSERAVRDRETAGSRWFARALRWEGTATIVIALLGLLAVMRLWLRGAIPELALRRSVGARRVHVLGRVAGRALLVTAGGLAIAWWLEPLLVEVVRLAVPGVMASGVALVRWPLLALAAATLTIAVATAWKAARSAPALLPGFADL